MTENRKQIIPEYWAIAKDGEAAVRRIFRRHYSYHHYKDNRKTKKIVGPGEYLMLITPQEDALFVWRKFRSKNNQQGVNCAVFRNEGMIKSSLLIKEAMYLAWQKWPNQRLYTYINAQKIKSTNPGYCFLQAGWQKCGITKIHKLIILEILPKLIKRQMTDDRGQNTEDRNYERQRNNQDSRNAAKDSQ